MTFDRLEARNRGAALTASQRDVTRMLDRKIEAEKQPTEGELQAIAKAMYEELLASLCAQQRQWPHLNDANLFSNQAYADYFQRLADHGGGLSFSPKEVARLRAGGWDEDRIEGLIEAVLLREEGHTGIQLEAVDRHLQQAGFTPHDRLRLRLEHALYRPYRDAYLAANSQLRDEMASPIGDMVVKASTPTVGSTPVQPAPNPVPDEWLTVTPTQAAELYIKSKPRLGSDPTIGKRGTAVVGEQTLRQIKCAARLLEQSMPADRYFWQLSDSDLLLLDKQFDQLPTSFGKSLRDHAPTVRLDRIVEETAERVARGDVPLEAVGLSIGTTNKHYNKLGQIHEFMRRSVPMANELDFIKYIRPINHDERDARARYTLEQGQAIFRLPPWTGHKSDDRLASGNIVVHDALFYVLLLVWYTGARREELCKLMVDDVQQAHGIWYLMVRPTETGRIKNSSSRRVIPICDELVRLGFLRFVEAMRASNERVLFPEIMPASGTSRKFGDVFYKIWWIYISPDVPELQRGQAMHSARHMVSTELKEKQIFLEFRNDLLGHRGKGGEGENRYPDRASLVRLKEVVERIPVVTSDLADQIKINLLPAHERKPRPSRK